MLKLSCFAAKESNFCFLLSFLLFYFARDGVGIGVLYILLFEDLKRNDMKFFKVVASVE